MSERSSSLILLGFLQWCLYKRGLLFSLYSQHKNTYLSIELYRYRQKQLSFLFSFSISQVRLWMLGVCSCTIHYHGFFFFFFSLHETLDVEILLLLLLLLSVLCLYFNISFKVLRIQLKQILIELKRVKSQRIKFPTGCKGRKINIAFLFYKYTLPYVKYTPSICKIYTVYIKTC